MYKRNTCSVALHTYPPPPPPHTHIHKKKCNARGAKVHFIDDGGTFEPSTTVTLQAFTQAHLPIVLGVGFAFVRALNGCAGDAGRRGRSVVVQFFDFLVFLRLGGIKNITPKFHFE